MGKFTTVAISNGIALETSFTVLADDEVQSENLLGFNSCKQFRLILLADNVRAIKKGSFIHMADDPDIEMRNKNARFDHSLPTKELVYAITKIISSAAVCEEISPEKIDMVKQRIIKNYASLFEDRIGKMKATIVHLDTDPNVVPKQKRHFPILSYPINSKETHQ